ncbi:hypothetical protein AAMO2058_000800900 [Amorphochlora amoebiformis]
MGACSDDNSADAWVYSDLLKAILGGVAVVLATTQVFASGHVLQKRLHYLNLPSALFYFILIQFYHGPCRLGYELSTLMGSLLMLTLFACGLFIHESLTVACMGIQQNYPVSKNQRLSLDRRYYMVYAIYVCANMAGWVLGVLYDKRKYGSFKAWIGGLILIIGAGHAVYLLWILRQKTSESLDNSHHVLSLRHIQKQEQAIRLTERSIVVFTVVSCTVSVVAISLAIIMTIGGEQSCSEQYEKENRMYYFEFDVVHWALASLIYAFMWYAWRPILVKLPSKRSSYKERDSKLNFRGSRFKDSKSSFRVSRNNHKSPGSKSTLSSPKHNSRNNPLGAERRV